MARAESGRSLMMACAASSAACSFPLPMQAARIEVAMIKNSSLRMLVGDRRGIYEVCSMISAESVILVNRPLNYENRKKLPNFIAMKAWMAGL